MDEVTDLLKTWELPNLIPKFEEQGITIQALSALTPDDIKDIIPLTGPRVLFMRCWRAWQAEFTNLSLTSLDLINFQLNQESTSGEEIITLSEDSKENVSANQEHITGCHQVYGSGLLESILIRTLEASSLLSYKGGTLNGDAARNLLSSVIAREILTEKTTSPIVGAIYFKWANAIKELFPGERTTTYYIPACTTASGAVLQARGKLVHQVLNKRRRLQQLGALTTKSKRSREESPSAPSSSSSPRPFPLNLGETDSDPQIVKEDIQWLRNASEPWSLVESKWKTTLKSRITELHSSCQENSLESYINEYPALKKPHGYTLLNFDFDTTYEEKKENLFIYFPVSKAKLLQLLHERKSKDVFSKEIINLADSSKQEDINLAAFLSIPSLLNTTTIKVKSPLKKKVISWRPSKAETRDAFIKHLKSDSEIGQYIEQRQKHLTNKGATVQPYIIIVGESLKKIKTCLVIVNQRVIYPRENIMCAVDTCYKAFWSLNAEYGIDAYNIWFFIQKGFYKMSSQFDRGSTSAESLLTDCDF